jgi:hypothetical protein
MRKDFDCPRDNTENVNDSEKQGGKDEESAGCS